VFRVTGYAPIRCPSAPPIRAEQSKPKNRRRTLPHREARDDTSVMERFTERQILRPSRCYLRLRQRDCLLTERLMVASFELRDLSGIQYERRVIGRRNSGAALCCDTLCAEFSMIPMRIFKDPSIPSKEPRPPQRPSYRYIDRPDISKTFCGHNRKCIPRRTNAYNRIHRKPTRSSSTTFGACRPSTSCVPVGASTNAGESY
jgi:hypothetical protein